MKKRALVTGATGKIGPLLVAELLRQNFKVRVLLRRESAYTSDSSLFINNRNSLALSVSAFKSSFDVETAWGDITDYNAVLAAASDADYIFHLAALLHINNPSASMYGKYYDINVIGTKNIVDAALKSGVGRVVIFSTISVYGAGSFYGKISPEHLYSEQKSQSDRDIFSYKPICLNKDIFFESSPINPLTIYAKTKALAEQYISDSVTVLRIASVYGTRVTGNYLRLVQAVQRGVFAIPVNDKGLSVYRTLIHEDDVAAGAILAAEHPLAGGRIYNLTDGEIHSLEDIINAIADAVCVNVKILKIHEKHIKNLINFIRKYNLDAYPNILSTNIKKALFAVDKLMENSAVDGQKIQSELGFKPKYNLKSGWQNALSCKKSDQYKSITP